MISSEKQASITGDIDLTADAVAVAVSGGPDSMALCHMLSQQPGAFRIYALIVDHGLRAESAAEAARTAEAVKEWPRVHPVVLTRETKPEDSESRVLERARDDRYRLMFDYCRDNGIKTLLTAHHRDDQAETFLFRLAKGSGLDGLCGMRARQDITNGIALLRPLLDVSKDELIEYCRTQGIQYADDSTNRNEAFSRPRLRAARDVLAKEGLTAERLSVTALRLSRAQEALEYYAQKVFETACIRRETVCLVFRFSELMREPEETRLRVIRRAAAQMAAQEEDGGYGPRLNRLEEIVNSMFSDADFRRASLGGCLFAVSRSRDEVTVEQEQKP